MEMQIGDLIGAIRKEGVDAARAEAERIVAEAKAQAAKIVADAEEQAARIAAKSESEVKILKDSAKVTAEHAKRDAVLAFKNAVREEFEKLLTADIDRTLEPETLAKLIRADRLQCLRCSVREIMTCTSVKMNVHKSRNHIKSLGIHDLGILFRKIRKTYKSSIFYNCIPVHKSMIFCIN